MLQCPSCGAPVSPRDSSCSWCGAANLAHVAASAKVQVLLARGIEAYMKGYPSAAIEVLTEATQLDPELFDAYFYLCTAWSALRQYEQAIAAMERARSIRGGNAALHFNLGSLHAHQGRTADARACFEEALRLAETDPQCTDRDNFVQRIRADLAALDRR